MIICQKLVNSFIDKSSFFANIELQGSGIA